MSKASRARNTNRKQGEDTNWQGDQIALKVNPGSEHQDRTNIREINAMVVDANDHRDGNAENPLSQTGFMTAGQDGVKSREVV